MALSTYHRNNVYKIWCESGDNFGSDIFDDFGANSKFSKSKNGIKIEKLNKKPGALST